MTRDETIKVLAIMKAAWPNSFRDMTKEAANGTITVWTLQFAKVPAQIVMIAINKLINKNTFAPSIQEVKEKIRGLYWEAWTMLQEHKRGGHLDEKTVASLKQIIAITEPMRTQLEPTLGELLEGYNGYLSGGISDETKQLN